MRKIILFIASSLDGYIARKDGGIDWLFTDQDYGFKEFYDSIDTVLMGRKTHDLSLTFNPWPHPGKQVVVFTKNKKIKQDSRVEFFSNPIKLTQKLLKEKGKNIWLVGGGEIVSEFLNAGLIDEIRLFIHPIILGGGIPLFTKIEKEIKLKVLGERKFSSGLIELCYELKRLKYRN